MATRGQRLPAQCRVLRRPNQPVLLLKRCAGVPPGGLPAHVEVVRVEPEPARLVRELHGRGLRRVLPESCPVLLPCLLTTGAVDELCLMTPPLLAGARSLPVRAAAPAAHGAAESVLEADAVLLCRWRLTGR